MKSPSSKLKDKLIFTERVEKAGKEHDKGKFETKSKDEFLKELRAC